MFDFLLTDEQKALRDEAREFARWFPKEMLLDNDSSSGLRAQIGFKSTPSRTLMRQHTRGSRPSWCPGEGVSRCPNP